MQVKHDLTKLQNFISALTSKSKVKVGIFSGIPAHPDERKETSDVDNAYIGLLHELGSFERGIPIRSWLTMPLRVSSNEIVKEASYGLPDLLAAGKLQRVLQEFGFACEDAILQAFGSGGFGTWKPISKRTADAKGSTAILIDTGQLRRAVASEVIMQ